MEHHFVSTYTSIRTLTYTGNPFVPKTCVCSHAPLGIDVQRSDDVMATSTSRERSKHQIKRKMSYNSVYNSFDCHDKYN